MKVAKAQFTGKNWKMNEDTWGDLDTWERRDHELIRGYLNDAPEEFKNESWKLRMSNIQKWWPLEERNGNNSWNAPDGKKRIVTIKNNYEDGIKLEPWISWRKGKDLRGTLLRSSKSENDDEKHHHELLRHSGRIKRKRLSQRWKQFENDLGEGMRLMKIHSYVKLQKDLWQ